jgi:ribokinase
MDLVLKVSTVPVAGQSCLADGYSNTPGGKGANQAAAAAQLGGDVAFIGKIGTDANGAQLKKNLEDFGVDTSCIKTDGNASTGLAIVMVEPDAKNRILVAPGSNMLLMPEDVVPVIETGLYDALIVQLEIPQKTVIAACRAAMNQKMTVVVDAGPAQNFPLDEVSGVTVLSPNETETLTLCGICPDTEEKAKYAAKLLMQKANAKYVVIKRGENGAYVCGEGVERNFAAPRVHAVDTTAAGDAFTAALTVRLIKCNSIEEAVSYANYVGALTVTKAGAQSSLPTAMEVEKFIIANSQC